MSAVKPEWVEAGWAALEAADADDTINTLGDVRTVLEAVLPLTITDS